MPEEGESAPEQKETLINDTGHDPVAKGLSQNHDSAKEDTLKNGNEPREEPDKDEFGLPVKRTKRRVFAEFGGEGTPDAVETKENPFEDPENHVEDGNGHKKLDTPREGLHTLPEAVDGGHRVNGVETKGKDEARKDAKTQEEPAQTDVNAQSEVEEKFVLHDIADKPRPTTDRNARASKRDYGYNKTTNTNGVYRGTEKVSEFSHQQLSNQQPASHDALPDLASPRNEEWQDMPALAPYDVYDDEGHLIAREAEESDDEAAMYAGLGGAGKGYTKVQIDEDAESATSMDDNTAYLFKDPTTTVVDEDDDVRNPLAQMQATKDLLTEGQRIAYVGVVKVAMEKMIEELDSLEKTRGAKKSLELGIETMQMWSQKAMLRLYQHMEISQAGMSYLQLALDPIPESSFPTSSQRCLK